MIRLALLLAGGVVLALVLAQVFLPRIAAGRISSRLGRYGTVVSVRVKAWPAVELLWGDADSVSVRVRSLKLSSALTAQLLWEARGINDMNMTASSVQDGPVRFTDVSLRKHGKALAAQARTTNADVRAALAKGFDVQLVSSERGELRVRASGGLFGVGASVDALVGASDGKLVVHPLGSLPSALKLTLFSEPHLYVEGVGAAVEDSRSLSYRLTMSASLR
jgi:hypothetical protein